MILGVTGGRNFDNDEYVYNSLTWLSSALGEHGVEIEALVHGDASGVDRIAKKWADSMGILACPYPADWRKYGNAAGPLRNERMNKVIDALAVFPGGRGTADMRTRAEKRGLIIYDFTTEKKNG